MADSSYGFVIILKGMKNLVNEIVLEHMGTFEIPNFLSL